MARALSCRRRRCLLHDVFASAKNAVSSTCLVPRHYSLWWRDPVGALERMIVAAKGVSAEGCYGPGDGFRLAVDGSA